jgi:hypothetical protein
LHLFDTSPAVPTSPDQKKKLTKRIGRRRQDEREMPKARRRIFRKWSLLLTLGNKSRNKIEPPFLSFL